MVPFTFDWTKARGVYSLASSSKKLIEGLKNETHFVVLMTAGSPPYRDLQVMLENCQSLNNKFMVDYVSPDTDAESYRQLARNFKKILPEQRFRGDTSGRGVLIVNGPMPDKPDHKVPYTFVPERKLYEYERGGPDSGGQYVFKAEDELLKELKFLLQDRAKRKIYFLQGNGEPTIGQAKAERRGQYRQSFQDVGVRFIVEKLKRDNYDVAGLTFDREPEKGKGDDIVPAKEEGPKKQKEIPEDCHTLILAGVSKTLPDEIVESIRRYMERGGKVGSRLMVFLDVVADPAYAKLVDTGLEPMLKRFGVEVTNEIAMGRMMHKNDDPGIVIASPPSGSENVLASQFVNDDYYFAGFARILKPASSGRFKAETILELRKRAQGLNEIIKQTDPKVLQNPQGYMMDLQKAGNVVQYQMLLSQTPEPVAVAVTEDGKPRVVVFGDTEFITDREMLVGQSNRENYALFLSALEWMAEKDSIGTRPRITTSYRFPAAARSMVYRMIFLPTWLMLLGIVSLGVCTWVVRRR
jgi:hypothetical protein